jgi:Domain of unknown function (DUF3387)
MPPSANIKTGPLRQRGKSDTSPNPLPERGGEGVVYDALEVNDSAVKVLGEPALKNIARELVSHVRKSVTIDWTLREAPRRKFASSSAAFSANTVIRRINRKRQRKRFWNKRSCFARNGLRRDDWLAIDGSSSLHLRVFALKPVRVISVVCGCEIFSARQEPRPTFRVVRVFRGSTQCIRRVAMA